MMRKLDLQKENDYLHVSIRGEYQKKGMKDTLAKLLDKCYENNIKGILLEVKDIIGQPTNIDRYDIAIAAAQKSLDIIINNGYPIIIAMVGPQCLIDPDGLAETTASNRGLRNKIFNDVAEARNWLTKKIK